MYLAVGVLATGAYFLLPTQTAQYVLRLLAVGSTSAAFVAGIVMHRPKRPLPWYVLGFAMLMPVLSSLTYVYYVAVLGIEPPRASVADAFFIATYVCVAAALLIFQSRRLARDRASTIDPIIVAVGVGMLAWVFLMKPYATDQSLPMLERLVLTTYPLMDVVLLAVVVRMLLVRGERPFSYYAMVTGLVSLLVFDAAYAATTLIGTYQNGNPIDALEILSFVFAGVAVLHPSMVDLSDKTVLEPETKLTRRRLALLAAASLMAPLLIALQWTRGGTIDVPVLVGGSVVLFLLVLGRMAGIMSAREEAIGREKHLRRTAAKLVAAPNRKGIYEVALDATHDLLGSESSSWAGIATGSSEEATLVASSGDNSGEVMGAQLHLDEYPDAVRTGLLEGRVVEAEGLNIAYSSRLNILGFNPDAHAVYLVPLLAQAQLRGAILILTDSLLSEDSQATLEALGREVTLALESTALSEEIHRRESEERFRALVQNSSDVVAIVRADGVTSYISPVVERILGYKPEHGVGRNAFQPPMMHPDDADRVRQIFARLMESPGAEATTDFRLRHVDGRWVQVEATSKNLLYDPNIGGIVVNYRDITERKNFEERLKHQAFHDPLTGLPNRALFMNRLGHALIRAVRSEKAAAVLFLDLDNFKVINDSLGHEAGDKLLVSIAERLRVCLRAEDTAARFGGDEFTILLEDVKDASDALGVASHVTRALSEPFALEARKVFITTSMGIALGTSGRERPTDLLRNADVALYRAKATGKATYEVFDPLMNIAALERLDLEVDLRRATERGEFAVYYQPQVEVATGKITGWEALVRWMHPDRGPIFPAAFLPAAEESGLIIQIGNLVLEEACRQAREWQQEQAPTEPPLKMSVNISARQLQRPDDLLGEIVRILRETDLAPGSLVMEITESMLMDDAEHNVDVLRRLQDLGVSIAVDDFGTGYSNLAYLKRFPVDWLKVDKSFVDGLGESPEATAIVEAMVSLATAMGMQTVAEGIETTGQADLLRALGCELGQGYYFSEPLPAHEANALLSTARALRD